MVIINVLSVDQKWYYTCWWSWMKTDGREFSMVENWPAGNNMVINPYMSEFRIILHDITTIIIVASKPFKNAHFESGLSTRRPPGRRIMNLVRKKKIELHLFQQYFTPHTPPLKQGESETTLSPYLPGTPTIRSTIPFSKCFKSCSPMSDFVNRYGPPAKTRLTCLVLFPFEHEPSEYR
jgi:hypothetical protein